MWNRIAAGGVHHGIDQLIGTVGRCHQSSPTINDVRFATVNSPNLHNDQHDYNHNDEHNHNDDTGALHRQRSEHWNNVGGGRRGNHVPWQSDPHVLWNRTGGN